MGALEAKVLNEMQSKTVDSGFSKAWIDNYYGRYGVINKDLKMWSDQQPESDLRDIKGEQGKRKLAHVGKGDCNRTYKPMPTTGPQWFHDLPESSAGSNASNEMLPLLDNFETTENEFIL